MLLCRRNVLVYRSGHLLVCSAYRDIANLFSDPPPGILVVPMEDDCTKVVTVHHGGDVPGESFR